MNRYSAVALAISVVAGGSMQLRAMPQATPQATSGTLSAKEVRQLEKTAVTESDHQRLAAYYETQAQLAEKKLEDAQALLKKWGPVEQASKTPDPYPHARRMVWEYTAELQKYSRLAADHEWMVEKYEVAARALKNGGTAADNNATDNRTPGSNPSGAAGGNAFTLGPKVK